MQIMLISLHRFLSYFCFAALASTHGPSMASPEPPLRCEIARGAWCIMPGVGKIETFDRDNKISRLTIIDEYWGKEVGMVTEGPACSNAFADIVEIVEINSDLLHNGRYWREIVVKLRRDNTCFLRLMVPTGDKAFVSPAASSLSGHLAACIAGRACTDHILAAHLYYPLVTGKFPSTKRFPDPSKER